MPARETIAILIPTFRRPDALSRALESALSQTVAGHRIRVYVIDNDAFRSARHVAEGKARVTYVPEPRAGVSHARNAGLAATEARFVFFLDDDMIAERGCLDELVRAVQAHDAGVAFAAVHARMPTDSALQDEMRPFFSRAHDMPEGPTENCMGAGGSLFDRSLCDFPTPAFDPALNASGGEDDRLLGHLRELGTRFVWVPSAHTVEDVPAKRATLSYVWKRNFAFGQGPTLLAHDRVLEGDTSAWRDVAKWMAVGVAQTLLRLPEWLVTTVLQLPSRARSHALLAQALGKIFWWSAFRKELYGANITTETVETPG